MIVITARRIVDYADTSLNYTKRDDPPSSVRSLGRLMPPSSVTCGAGGL
jgi:hypothetical protein